MDYFIAPTACWRECAIPAYFPRLYKCRLHGSSSRPTRYIGHNERHRRHRFLLKLCSNDRTHFSLLEVVTITMCFGHV